MERERIPTWVKTIVELEGGGICGICKKPIQFGEPYEIDHIYPVSKDGSNSLENIQISHKSCNRKKGGKKIMSGSDQWKVWWDLIEPNLDKLRVNQLKAYYNTVERFFNFEKYPDEECRIKSGGRPKIYCECTGAGKSILMIILGMFFAKKRILIITPTRVIKENNFDALEDSHNLGIIPKKVYDEIKITTLDKPNSLAYIHSADIIVSTYQKFGKLGSDRILANLRGDEFDVVLIDEAHHYKEDEASFNTIHRDIVRKFKNSIILFFTATPFDAKLNPILKHFDRERDVIHEYSYADAWKNKYVKYLEWTEINPEEQVLMITHPNGRTEKFKLIEDDLKEAKKIPGYKKALSRSRAMKLSLIYATVHLLDLRNDELRNRAKKNIALMVFPNIKEAEECKILMDSLNLHYKYCIVHSDVANKDEVINDIKRDAYDIVLSINLLKEGFDQKNITIVTLARKIESYVFFTQVIGRGVRARKDIHGNPIPVSGLVRYMKDICYIITHEGLELRKFWDLFRELDLQDLVDEEEERETERRERGEPTEIIDAMPIISIDDEKVNGYDSDGFDEGRTLRDETKAYYLVEAIKRSGDNELKPMIEKAWNRDNGRTLAGFQREARSLEFADSRNIPNGNNPDENADDKIITDEISNGKKDLQKETIGEAKKLAKILQRQLAKSLKRKLTPAHFKLIYDTFFQIYKHPLKGGSTEKGYGFKSRDIEFINEETPKLIELYRNPTYFATHFMPVYKQKFREKFGVD